MGPYSALVRANGFVFISGQVAIEPSSGERVDGDVTAQATRVMDNIAAMLGDVGLTTANVVKTTIFLADINDFAAVNEVYGGHFTDHPPARSTFQVGALPGGFLVEIEVIAVEQL